MGLAVEARLTVDDPTPRGGLVFTACYGIESTVSEPPSSFYTLPCSVLVWFAAKH